MRPVAVVLILALSSGLSVPARGDTLAESQGDEVRLTVAADTELLDAASGGDLRALARGSKLRARLQAFERDALLLELPDGRLARLDRAALGRLEVARQPRRGHVGRATLRGLLAGTLLSLLALGTCEDDGSFITCEDLALPLLAFGATAGGSVGLLVGAATSGTRWREVTDAHAREAARALPVRTGVALTLRF